MKFFEELFLKKEKPTFMVDSEKHYCTFITLLLHIYNSVITHLLHIYYIPSKFHLNKSGNN